MASGNNEGRFGLVVEISANLGVDGDAPDPDSYLVLASDKKNQDNKGFYEQASYDPRTSIVVSKQKSRSLRPRERSPIYDDAILSHHAKILVGIFDALGVRLTIKRAKVIIRHFGSVGHVLAASAKELNEIVDLTLREAQIVQFARTIHMNVSKSTLNIRIALENTDKCIEYLRVRYGYSSRQTFVALYLDDKNRLIEEQVHQVGTINHVNILNKEIVRQAVSLNAVGVIIVRTHSNDSMSAIYQDISRCEQLHKALMTLDLLLNDYIIVSPEHSISFRRDKYFDF